ncbi:unnamed protein product [Clonostachys byssicola]|uniref:Uncharacterized protein n=1 Tax=Clonostachys byssicola TaxID=160290 RepID=A0A9N9U0S3_9HYPO|nr:unnamed protein product [Clonostachys byssicola]
MIREILFPWALMTVSALSLPVTIIKFLVAGDLHAFTSWSTFRDAWFAVFWINVGPLAKQTATPNVIPLLQGRLKDGKVQEKVVSQPLHGAVLEIGRGVGMWTQFYKRTIDEAEKEGTAGPDKIYASEPNRFLATTLRKHIKTANLEEVYHVLPIGVEGLGNATASGAKIEPESLDCIVTVQGLCCIPEPEKNLPLLYRYLKKGGHWYVFEHVCNDESPLLSGIQSFTEIFWKPMVCCHLCRDTAKALRGLGKWEEIDLAPPQGESPYEMIPHIVGTLVK